MFANPLVSVLVDLLIVAVSTGIMTGLLILLVKGGRLPNGRRVNKELLLLGIISFHTLFLVKGSPDLLDRLLDATGLK